MCVCFLTFVQRVDKCGVDCLSSFCFDRSLLVRVAVSYFASRCSGALSHSLIRVSAAQGNSAGLVGPECHWIALMHKEPIFEYRMGFPPAVLGVPAYFAFSLSVVWVKCSKRFVRSAVFLHVWTWAGDDGVALWPRAFTVFFLTICSVPENVCCLFDNSTLSLAC